MIASSRFAPLLKSLMSCGDVTPVELSERFDASIPTVKRWMEGKSVPVPAMRELVIQWLIERVGGERGPEEET